MSSEADVTQIMEAQRQADTELMAAVKPMMDLGAIPRPRRLDGYVRPRSGYLIRLMSEAREASAKARAASETYNVLAAQAEARASLSHPEGTEAQRLAVKFARKGDTALSDAGIQYEFWKGEQHRLCAMIAAEHHMMEMMNHVYVS